MRQGEPALVLAGVARSFGALRAVNGVSLEVAAGETRAIIGPNGAGKTTLFGLISGELALTAGSIRFYGRDISRLPAHRRARAGLARTYQITNVFPGLSVEQNLTLALRGSSRRKFALLISGEPVPAEEARIEEVLRMCGIAERRADTASALSYGEQRQLELAIALAGRPRALLLDEPAAGLSPAERVPMAQTIRALHAALTVILIEHDMDLALGLADRVTCLHYGEVLAEGAPDEIRRDPRVQEVYLGAGHAHA